MDGSDNPSMDPNVEFFKNQRSSQQQPQSHLQQPQLHNSQPPSQQPQFTFPQNFDISSLPPAERELLLRRFQLQQQQQQQLQHQAQLQRALQAQAQLQGNFQRMTMSAYTTPRPPLNSSSPPTVHHAQGFPLHMNPQQQIPFNNFPPSQMMARPVMPTGINPNLLQQPTAGIKQINPQQFTNPLQAPLKSDPVLYTPVSQNPAPSVQQNLQFTPVQVPVVACLNLPAFDEQVMSSEGNFIDHLVKFLDAIKFNNRVVPQIANRPVSLYRLFQIVNSAGGFVAVGETKKWPLVTQALQLPAQSYEVVSTLRATYYTFLYPYEQYFIQKKTLDKIEWPNKSQVPPQPQNVQRQPSIPSMPSVSSVPSMPQPQPQSTVSNNVPAPLSQSQIPIQFIPQTTLKHIPESELALWKPFADVMKVPISPICDIDTAILYMNSPYFTLKLEALLATQKLFSQASPKELQLADVSADSLGSLLDSLEQLWNESISSVEVRCDRNKTMETFWSEVDNKKRDIYHQLDDDMSQNRSLIICRQIASLLRTLTVTKGADIAQFLSRSNFIKSSLIPFGLIQSNDWELYKDTLIIFEALASHISSIETELLEWTINQCQAELNQVRNERLISFASKFTGSLNLDRISSFDNINTARQSVSVLITQSAQLWKSVPAHIFLHLSSCLSALTSSESITFPLDGFVVEIEKFMDIFVLPTASLLRSIRALYECQGCSIEEIRRVLETIIYSPSFSLTDGGFLEICLQILTKCHSHQPESMECMNWNGVIVLLRELREFWRHEDNASVTNLGKSCYQVGTFVSGSPAKPARSSNNSKLSLSIVNGASSIVSVFSHPFLLLCKCLDILASNFQSLPDAFKLDLLELAMEWNLDTPSKWGREVLASEKFEVSLNNIREYFE